LTGADLTTVPDGAGRLGLRDWWRRWAGLRHRVMVAFAVGGLLLSTVLATSTFLIARGYLLDQRERSAVRQAYAEASYVRDGLLTAQTSPSEIIGDISPRSGARVLVRYHARWYSSDLVDASTEVPAGVVSAVVGGAPAFSWTRIGGEPAVVTGVPLPAVDAQFYEIASVSELDRTLAVLRSVLIVVALVTSVAAVVVGRYVARRVVRPLDDVAAAATAIAAGRMDTRLAPTRDPDLLAIVGSFNTMVDALAARIEREVRFTADVSHELRSPMTTLVTGVELLVARRADLPERSRVALDLVDRELGRFQATLDDLLELARLDASSPDGRSRTRTGLVDLVRHVLSDAGRDASLLYVDDVRCRSAIITVERPRIERAVLNLLDNADSYGGGPTRVGVRCDASSGYISVDDEGPGVPEEERGRIFARFARGDGSRGSKGGTGLGLSIVLESVRRDGGSVWCTSSPVGGARFVIRLPLEPVPLDARVAPAIGRPLTTGSAS
jgi:two-component system, OmpR family, sensor histidine kinase MtrB